jgi:hypothetical protein
MLTSNKKSSFTGTLAASLFALPSLLSTDSPLVPSFLTWEDEKTFVAGTCPLCSSADSSNFWYLDSMALESEIEKAENFFA